MKWLKKSRAVGKWPEQFKVAKSEKYSCFIVPSFFKQITNTTLYCPFWVVNTKWLYSKAYRTLALIHTGI